MKPASPSSSKPPYNSPALSAWPHILFGLIVCALLGPSIFGSAVPAFRDTLHFYFPLWYFLDQQSALENLVPTWNPLDACGSSILAEPTSAIFYPLRAIFWIPQLHLSQRIGVYLAIHLLLAYANAFWAAREFGRIGFASVVTSYCYALSGPVFFQIYNPVFLVGAAWLPMAWRYAWRIRNRPTSNLQNIAGLAVALAMMVLGGDAQLAFHTVLGGAWLLVVSSIWQPLRVIVLTAWRWFLGALLAVGLSAIQILPTLCWWSISDRVDSQDRIYHFSVAPWHLTTILFPNVLGSFTPVHTRWISMFPAEGMMWVPSLHFGVVGLLGMIAFFSFYPRRTNNMDTAMVATVAIMALLSSFGGYGLGWMVRSGIHVAGWNMDSFTLPDEWGSLQWLWVETIPGYSSFRFPAKWLTLFAWTCSLLAGNGLSQLLEGKNAPRWLRRITLATIFFSTLTAIAFSIPTIRDQILTQWHAIPDDSICGPIDLESSRMVILRSLCHGTVVMLLVLALFLVQCVSIRLHLALLLIGIELSTAAWLQTSFVSEADLHAYAQAPPMTESELPKGELIRSQVVHRLAKFHLLTGERNWDASLTITPRALALWRANPSEGKILVDASPLDAGMHGRWKQSWVPELVPSVGNELHPSTAPQNLHATWLALGSLRVDYDLAEKTTILLPLFQDGGWQAQNSLDQSVEISVDDWDGLRSTLTLPAGKGVAIVHYRPPGLIVGSFATLLAWVLLAVLKWKKS